MRYQDWDVLLFPAESQAAHVPLKEFKTACYAEQLHGKNQMTPVLTTFVPSLPRGQPFQISLHVWSQVKSLFSFAAKLAGTKKPTQLWQVEVVIDAVRVCVERFAIDAPWPHLICEFGRWQKA